MNIRRNDRGEIVPMRPSIWQPVGTPTGPRGIALVSPEEIIRAIDDWRKTWPELASREPAKSKYKEYYQYALKRLQEGQG